MLDALLYATRDTIRNADIGYRNADTCEIMDNGEPPARCGNLFVAVHQAATRTSGETDNKLEEYFGFSVTLTQRIKAPPDQIGWRELAVQTAKQTGFNRRVEQLRALLHMNWGLIQDANNNLLSWAYPNQGLVYGFSEPARYKGVELPRIVGPAWFKTEPSKNPRADENFGLAAELQFADARRFQPIAEYV